MSSTYPFDVGAYQCQWPRTVSAPAEAMEWFDRGVGWAYAFNHEEAIWCFERSIACSNASWRSAALGHLAVAWCLGPNYNDPDVSTDDAAKARSHCRRPRHVWSGTTAQLALMRWKRPW